MVDRAEAWCDSIGYRYLRLNPPVSQLPALDTTEDNELNRLIQATDEYMKEKYEDEESGLRDVIEKIQKFGNK